MFSSVETSGKIVIGCLCATAFLCAPAMAGADPTTDQASNDTLAGLVPAGSADCHTSQRYAGDPFLARLGCGQNSQAGGPYTAVYSLYGSSADVDVAFGRLAGSGTPVACPGSAVAEPVSWGGGMVVCTTARGPRDGAPTVSWTRTADLFVGSATGDDLATLYTWWLTAR